MRQEQAAEDPTWMDTRTQRNQHRNATQSLKKEHEAKSRLQRKVEAIMSGAGSAMSQMS